MDKNKPEIDYSKMYSLAVKGTIIFLTFLIDVKKKEDNIKLSAKISADVLKILTDHKKEKMQLLIDMRPLENQVSTTRQSRFNYASMAVPKVINKVATVTKNIYVKIIVKSVIFISGMNIKFDCFDNIDDAIVWLKK